MQPDSIWDRRWIAMRSIRGDYVIISHADRMTRQWLFTLAHSVALTVILTRRFCAMKIHSLKTKVSHKLILLFSLQNRFFNLCDGSFDAHTQTFLCDICPGKTFRLDIKLEERRFSVCYKLNSQSQSSLPKAKQNLRLIQTDKHLICNA